MFSFKHYITPGNLWQKLVIQSSFVRLADFSSPRLQAGAPKPGNWVELFNACVEGVEATISFHLCFGNFRGRPATSNRSFSGLAPHFKDLNVDVIHIEFANRNMYEIELWEKYGGDKILCAGVIDVKGRSLEPVEVVTDRIRTALKYCAPEKLWIAPDCGFSQTVRWLAVEKMKVMVNAAEIIRKELG
jgi:5-methyltetrahydropteroyltriglutamate--homocysteine methyltransferase